MVGTKTAGTVGAGILSHHQRRLRLRLSVASLNLLNGGAIDKVGVTPDQVVDMPAEQLNYLELLTAAEDPQIQAALKSVENGQPLPPATTAPETTTATAPSEAAPTGDAAQEE